MSSRDRVAPMQPADNLPAGRPRRPPPDEPTAPATSSKDLTVVPDMSDSASKLASMLAGSDKPDSRRAADAGPSVPLSALTSPPPLDPELDLVPSGVRWPRYLGEAIRTKAFLTRRTQQEVVLDALLGRDPLPPELIDECRRSATRTRH